MLDIDLSHFNAAPFHCPLVNVNFDCCFFTTYFNSKTCLLCKLHFINKLKYSMHNHRLRGPDTTVI